MSSRRLCVVSALICYLVTAAIAEPSCDGVLDFGACNGDTAGFCPRGIECGCKAGHAFCSCPNYKGPHADYWYMGAKCDQLWSTWDLLLMAVFPGVALAFVVAVVAQLIHYCKTTAKMKTVGEKKSRSKNQSTEPEERPGRSSRFVDVPLSNLPPQSQHNPAAWAPQNPQHRASYYPDVPPAGRNLNYAEVKPKKPKNLGKPSYGYPDQDYDIEPRPAQQFSSNLPPQSQHNPAAWAPQNPQHRASYYPDVPPAGRNLDYAEVKPKKPKNVGQLSRRYPDQDYDDEPRPAQQFSRFAAPSTPQADYSQGGPDGPRLFSFGRPQVNLAYEY